MTIKNIQPKTWGLPVEWNGRRYSDPADVPGALAPTPPTIALGSPTSSAQPITITGGANATSWVAQYKQDASSTWLDDGVVTVGAGSYTYTGLNPATLYNYRIAATNIVDTVNSNTATGSTGASGSIAFNYRNWGVPYITDALPQGIFPTLPSRTNMLTSHEWYGVSSSLDPLVRPSPQPGSVPNWPTAENAEYIYVDKFHGAATDTANTYGFPSKPRLTIPATIAANIKAIFVKGKNTDDQTQDYAWVGGDGTISNVQRTVTDPLFIIGIDMPNIGRKLDWSNCKHIICRDFRISWNGSAARGAQWSLSNGSVYFVLQRVGLFGRRDNTTAGSNGGAAFQFGGSSTAPVQFVVCHQCEIAYHGGYLASTKPTDYHGFRPTYYVQYAWCIDSIGHHLSGDTTQVGNSNNTNPLGAEAHYVWFANNESYENRENMVDCKNSRHIFAMKNHGHDFLNGPTDGTMILLSNNGEGPYTGYHWACFNRLHTGSAMGIRDSGNQSGERNYSWGNLIYDTVDSGIENWNSQTNRRLGACYNTVARCGSAIDFSAQSQASSEIDVDGNIGFDCGATTFNGDNGWGVANLRNCYGYDPNATVAINGGHWDTTTGTVLNVDPDFADAPNNDFNLAPTSPCIASGGDGTQHRIAQEFYDLYGLRIDVVDLFGNPRPQGGDPWSSGAIQYTP